MRAPSAISRSLKLIAVSVTLSAVALGSQIPAGAGEPSTAVQTEYLMTLHAPFAPPLAVDQSLIIFGVPATGGWVKGPRTKGKLVGPAGDWQRVMPSGVTRLDVRGTIQADTNDLIFFTYSGAIQCSKEQIDRLNAGEELKTGDCYFITAPTFETKSEKYNWLNAVQAVGKMTSVKFGDHIEYEIFAVK
jgi:hypothetical protein